MSELCGSRSILYNQKHNTVGAVPKSNSMIVVFGAEIMNVGN